MRKLYWGLLALLAVAAVLVLINLAIPEHPIVNNVTI